MTKNKIYVYSGFLISLIVCMILMKVPRWMDHLGKAVKVRSVSFAAAALKVIRESYDRLTALTTGLSTRAVAMDFALFSTNNEPVKILSQVSWLKSHFV